MAKMIVADYAILKKINPNNDYMLWRSDFVCQPK